MSFWDFFRTPAKNTPSASRPAPAATWNTVSSSASSGSQPEDGGQVDAYDMQGKRLELGAREYKTSGGEGAVYSCPLNPRILVKIYKRSKLEDPAKMKAIHARIMDMAGNGNLAKQADMAWPLMPVFDANRNVIGFAMHKCEGSSLLALRGPANIQKHFPGWNRRNLVETALDFVQKVKLLTNQGVLINDFNPANFLVDARGKVSFIDCDSYQVPAAQGGVHISRTYFPSYSAPELIKNKSLLGQKRNIHHVEFGTAMIVFHILMCGLHPYNYFDPSHQSDCGTPDENLLKGRCPLGTGAGCKMPPGNWFNLWSHLTYSLKTAFISTFREGHGDLNRRTTLDQWETELKKMLYVMGQDPVRNDLMPRTAKPHIDNFTVPQAGQDGRCFQ